MNPRKMKRSSMASDSSVPILNWLI